MPGIEELSKRFKVKRKLLVDAQGISLEEFFSHPDRAVVQVNLISFGIDICVDPGWIGTEPDPYKNRGMGRSPIPTRTAEWDGARSLQEPRNGTEPDPYMNRNGA